MKRHIHCKNSFSKMFSHLVVTCAKEKMMQNMSKFQIGSKSGHRPEENVFVMTSFLIMCEKYKKCVILQLMDYSKLFDRESLKDCLSEIYRNEVKGKLYRLFYQMNKKNVIQVKTPVGVSETADTNEGLGQGGIESVFLSAVSLDGGSSDMFKDSSQEVFYGDIKLAPLLYMDDSSRFAYNVLSAQAGFIKMDHMAKGKLLDYNMKKMAYMVFGSG